MGIHDAEERTALKREEELTMDGHIVVILTPENDEDIRQIERLIREGKLDPRDGFSSDPSVWRKRRRGKQGKNPDIPCKGAAQGRRTPPECPTDGV